MLGNFRKLVESAFIRDSVPALAQWGKRVPPSLIRSIQADGFRDLVRYAAPRQEFFSRKLLERGIDVTKVRRPDDLRDIFTTSDDLLNFPIEDFLCSEPQAVFETTGTSGAPKRVYFTYQDLEFAARSAAAPLYPNS